MTSIRRLMIAATLAATAAATAQVAGEATDVDAYRRIREEGLTRSQVMVLASELVDGIGPRRSSLMRPTSRRTAAFGKKA